MLNTSMFIGASSSNLMLTAIALGIIVVFICFCGALYEVEQIKRKDAK